MSIIIARVGRDFPFQWSPLISHNGRSNINESRSKRIRDVAWQHAKQSWDWRCGLRAGLCSRRGPTALIISMAESYFV